MTIQVIRNQNNEIVTGNFCQFGRKSVGGDLGGFTPIEISPETQFPNTGKIVAFKVPNPDYRFSINVNGQNLLGTLNEVVSELYQSYGIYTSYTTGSDVVFTYDGEYAEFYNIAIKGVSESVDNLEIYENPEYCETYILSNGIFLFSLRQSGDYSYLPLSEGINPYYEFAPMDAQLNYKIYDSPIDVLPIRTDVNLKTWYLTDEFTEVVDRNRIVNYYQPYEKSVSLGEVIDNRNTETEFSYQKTYTNLVMHTLSASLFGYGIGDSSTWSSSINQMAPRMDCWFDFTNDPTRNPFIIKKGYAPYLGMPY